MGTDGLLAGVTVLDHSTVGPAARATAALRDLGATVVKVAAPVSAARIDPPFYAYGAHREMKRVRLDLKSDDGVSRFLGLVADSDAVVEAFRPGVADRLGVGYDACRKANPRIVYCAISGYGSSGPYARWAGHDINYLAVGGYLATQGNALPGATVADSAGGGMHAAISILAALLRREKWASGAYLDVSTTNGVLFLMALQIDQYLATGEEAGPGTTLLTGKYACYDTYECRDGKAVSVGAIEAQFFRNLCEALGLPELAAAQFDDDRQDEIRKALAEAFAQKDRDVWVSELAPKDTCVAPVLSVAEAAHAFPQLDVDLPEHGRIRQLASTIAGSVMAAEREARKRR